MAGNSDLDRPRERKEKAFDVAEILILATLAAAVASVFLFKYL